MALNAIANRSQAMLESITLLLDTLQQSTAALSAADLLEAANVEARQGPDAARDLELLVDGAIDEIASVDLTLVETALNAWRRFGKGRHPAGLNFGDCFAYALARPAA